MMLWGNLLFIFFFNKSFIYNHLIDNFHFSQFCSTMQYMLLWANFRRFYLYVMTENMKRVLIAHRQCVLNEEVKNRFQLCERTILSAATLPEFDEAYTRQENIFNQRHLIRINFILLLLATPSLQTSINILFGPINIISETPQIP